MKTLEKWEIIPGYDGSYSVSNHGRVRSNDRIIVDVFGKVRSLKGRIMKQSKPIKGSDYFRVCLTTKEHISTNLFVHRLVAFAFVDNPNIEQYTQVNHEDGYPGNNHFTNLKWVSPAMNTKHAIETGLSNFNGENSPRSKLTNKDVIRIRESKDSARKLAKELCVSSSTIDNVRKRKTWKMT